MKAVITGDIINSRTKATRLWQPKIKKILRLYGKETIDWEVFRGDSFQLGLPTSKCLKAALHIKATIKQIEGLDVRMGIGIGKQDFKAKKITLSTGSAFVRSGESFDFLKKQTMAISTGDKALDETLNLMIMLSLLTINNWSETVAKVIATLIENPQMNQTILSRKLKKSQSSISESLKRGGYAEVSQMEQFCSRQIEML